MKHNQLFKAISNPQDNEVLGLFGAVVKEAELFVVQCEKANLIDNYEGELQEKLNYRIYTFKIAGPASDVRYANRSVLSNTWVDAAKTEKGIIEPRRKHVDYYLRIRENRQTGYVSMTFNVLGFGRHAARIGLVESVEVDKFDRNKTNPFFKATISLMQGLHPVLVANANKYIRKLDRLTKP